MQYGIRRIFHLRKLTLFESTPTRNKQKSAQIPPKINLDSVNKIIFVSDTVRETASQMFNWPDDKMTVIHNYVNTQLFDRVKSNDSEYTLAIIGIVPQRKRLDRAVDLVRSLQNG